MSDKMPSLRAGVNDLTSRKHDYVTRDQVGQMVADVVREALNVALKRLAQYSEQREDLIRASILDELVAKGVLPPLDQSEENVVGMIQH